MTPVACSAACSAADNRSDMSNRSLAEALNDALPQTQCTRCGYADCRAYADAIANDGASINRCPPGGAEGIERLAALTARLAEGLRGGIADVPQARMRAPHILSLGFRNGMPKELIGRLAAENIHVAPRLGRMRISPHVYNDESDIDRFVEAFHRLMPSR